eukprot:776533-Pelagomonas_calceolata.AAC.5
MRTFPAHCTAGFYIAGLIREYSDEGDALKAPTMAFLSNALPVGPVLLLGFLGLEGRELVGSLRPYMLTHTAIYMCTPWIKCRIVNSVRAYQASSFRVLSKLFFLGRKRKGKRLKSLASGLSLAMFKLNAPILLSCALFPFSFLKACCFWCRAASVGTHLHACAALYWGMPEFETQANLRHTCWLTRVYRSAYSRSDLPSSYTF